MVRRRSGNQYSIPMWGYVIQALALMWLVLGRTFLGQVIEDSTTVWVIYLGVIVAWLVLVLFAWRAKKAAQLVAAADEAAPRS